MPGPDFEAAGPDFEAAGPDFEAAGPGFEAPWVGSCVPGQTLKLGKPELGHFVKTWIGIFSKYFENRGMFSNYFEKIPPPPGAAAPGVFFQTSLKTYPYFQNILKICKSMFFKVAQFRFSKFQGLARDARSHLSLRAP